MNWQTAELLGYAYYSKRGYRIFVALVRNDGYDFVAEKDGKFVRVNVKVAGLKDKTNPNSWSISQASGGANGHSTKAPCDVFLTYLPEQHQFIELPGSFLSAGNSKSRRLPKEMFLA
jgi:hypothetical protein